MNQAYIETSFSRPMMYHVLFVGSRPAESNALSGQYYKTLQPILPSLEGFIEETSFGDPSRPDVRLLLARFADEAAIERWRNHPQHLKIMQHARTKIFQWYRITIGKDTLSPLTTEATTRVVIIYQRPCAQETHSKHTQLPLKIPAATLNLAEDPEMFVADSQTLWIFRMKNGVSMVDFESNIERVDGDSVHLVQVVREYTQSNRVEAPVDIA